MQISKLIEANEFEDEINFFKKIKNVHWHILTNLNYG